MGTLLFGPFRVDISRCQLWREEEPINLAPKTLDLLIFLAERPGEVITRDQIFQALWPETYVDDHALSVQIGDLRKALGDDARNPQYIETRHRRGYLFKANVTKVDAAKPSLTTPEQASASYVKTALPIPETHYARSGDLNIAYEVIGDGPIDLVFVMGWVSHLEYFWTEPRFARFLRRLSSFGRLILFDKRGTGLSDHVPVEHLPTLEQRMSDVRAVMEAAGASDAVICGVSEGGCMSALFAATYPEETKALIMIAAYAKRVSSPDYPWAPTPEERDQFLREIRDHWGGPVGLAVRAPSLAGDPQFRQWWATYLRMGASPGAALALTRMNTEVDIRDVLPHIGVPTLVVHRTGDMCIKVEEGRYIASRIPDAHFVELPGEDHLPFVGDQDAILDEVQRFLSQRQSRSSEHILATIVAAELTPVSLGTGDHRKEQLTAAIESQRIRFRATAFQHDEQQLFAAFDGPARAVQFACALQHEATDQKFASRIGLHTGQYACMNGKFKGAAVQVASCIRNRAASGQVLVSGTVRDLVAGSGLIFAACGRLEVEGIGEWQLLKVQQAALCSAT